MNYKHSFLALVFAVSALSYSNAYDFCPEEKGVCSEMCTAKTTCCRHESEKNPLTIGSCIKAGVCVAGYWLYLEKVTPEIETRYGESAKKVSEFVPFVLFQKQLRAFGESAVNFAERLVTDAVRASC